MRLLIAIIALVAVFDRHADCATPRKQMEHPRGYVCYRARAPICIDGRLEDAAWQTAPWTEDFGDILGAAGPKPRFRTRARLLWDDEYLYIGAELEEPHVWATLAEHDSVIFQDPDFEVFIDPDGDNHNYYEIEINALDTEWDLRLVKPYRDGGPALNEWEIPGLKKAVHVDGTLNDPRDRDGGWSVELALPWKVLREFANRPAPPRHGDQWRVNFSRVEWQIEVEDGKYRKVPNMPEDNWVWSPQGVVDMHRPERWGYVQFSTRQPGTDKFARDPFEPARDYLMRLYYAERAYHESHMAYAESDSALAPLNPPPGVSNTRIQGTADGYVATVHVRIPNGQSARWHVAQDSRLWRD